MCKLIKIWDGCYVDPHDVESVAVVMTEAYSPRNSYCNVCVTLSSGQVVSTHADHELVATTAAELIASRVNSAISQAR